MLHRSCLIILMLVVLVAKCANTKDQNDSNECTLPGYPKNGRWSIAGPLQSLEVGENVSSGTIISVTCNTQYTLEGASLMTCLNGKWSPKMGKCLKLCPPIVTTTSTQVNCVLNTTSIDCQKAIDGTVATFSCAPYYENSELNRNPFRFCRNGFWSQEIPSCVPVCGVKPQANGTTEPYYPWNVALYITRDNKKLLSCVGTLVNERVVITVAHCVADESGLKNEGEIMLVAGKSSEEYQDSEDLEAQYIPVENIFVPEEYLGVRRKYEGDIAVLIAKHPFNMTSRVQPACLDWSNKYAKEFKYPKITGSIAAPLESKGWPSPNKTYEIEIDFVNHTQCYHQLFSLTNASLESYYTYDKLCSGYINTDKSAHCRVNHGVGLITKNPFDRKYFLTGVLSLFPSLHREDCNNKRWTMFTEVSKHNDFIVEKSELYTSIKRVPFQTSCGVKSVQAQTLIVNGNNVTKGDYPWQVAVYQIDGRKKTLICGGSLINQRVILTAAHCVTDTTGNVLPKEQYAVAVGKYYRNFDDPRDKTAQFSSLKEIAVPNLYQGELQNYFADIAVLITESSFVLSRDVEPVCIDWDAKYEAQFLRPSSTGFVSGWGYTEQNSKPSEELKDLEVPYIEREHCKSKLPADNEIYLTQDKLCSGFLNQSKGVCNGDSGGGLVFKNINDERYYLAGIVSLSPQASTGGCDSQQYAMYTKVSVYVTDFIKEKVRLYWA